MDGKAIALGPTLTDNNDKMIDESEESRPKPRFVDEVKIGGDTVLNISIEHIFDGEEKPKRKSRWADVQDKKKKAPTDVVFNPYHALGQPLILPITDSNKENEEQQKTDKTSKWGPAYEKIFQPPPLHYIPRDLPCDEVEYLIRLYRLDEINKNLSAGYLEIADPDIRSPSPDPIYDQKTGVRVNTREKRAQEKLRRERDEIIEECSRIRKNFVPPGDYRPPKKNKKIYLPTDDPDAKYIGMIIGPKGETQKKLEQKTNCKISIRGKGSAKQKRIEIDSDDKLHVLIQSENEENLENAALEIQKILSGEDVEVNEQQKAKNLQLMAVSSALKEDFCESCGEKGHKIWACPNKTTTWKKVNVICAVCKDRSHPTSDCPLKKTKTTAFSQIGLNNELSRLLSEVSGAGNAANLQGAGGLGNRVTGANVGFLTTNTNPVFALMNGAPPIVQNPYFTQANLFMSQQLGQPLSTSGQPMQTATGQPTQNMFAMPNPVGTGTNTTANPQVNPYANFGMYNFTNYTQNK